MSQTERRYLKLLSDKGLVFRTWKKPLHVNCQKINNRKSGKK